MEQIKPATIVAKLLSYVTPKKLTAQVRTETLANGAVQVTPFYTIDGQEVPAELVDTSEKQQILGYNVVLDKRSRQVAQKTLGRTVRLTKKAAAQFLYDLRQSGVSVRNRDGKSQPLVEYVKPGVSLELRGDDTLKVKTHLETSTGMIVEKPKNFAELKRDEGWFGVGDDILGVQGTGTSLDQILFSANGNGVLSNDDVPRFLKTLDQHTDKIATVEKDPALQQLAVFSGAPHNQATVSGDSNSITVSPALVYAGAQGREYEFSPNELDVNQQRSAFRRVQDGWIEITKDAVQGFDQACDELKARLGTLSGLRGEAIPQALAALTHLANGDPTWMNGWSVLATEAVKNHHQLDYSQPGFKFKLNIVESDGKSLMELDPIYDHGRFAVSYEDVEAAAKKGAEWTRQGNSWVKIDKGLHAQVKDQAKQLGLKQTPKGFSFPANRHEEVVARFAAIGAVEPSKDYAEFKQQLIDVTKLENVPLPSNLRSGIKLRPYQQQGYNWLTFLHKCEFNGILADDMGLGKTLQTLAAIQRARETSGSKLPSLIICPTSVVQNWRSEIYKFFNDCEVWVCSGSEKAETIRLLKSLATKTSRRKTSPLVITSYDTARQEQEVLERIEWLYVIADEAHFIKNPDAARTKAVKSFTSHHKVALTGTPIQNNLEELWSLFDFIMPEFLGTRTDFRSRYSRNQKVNWSAVNNDEVPLKTRVRPFVLRRMKEDVAKDLPQKTLVELDIELTPRQAHLYKQIVYGPEYQKMLTEVGVKGVRRARMAILTAIHKVRAICNHPDLSLGNQDPTTMKVSDSGKLMALKDLLEEIVDGEHRTLIFSQFTKVLDIIQHCFKDWGYDYLRLDGQTPAGVRQQLVDEFNHNQDIPVFLISTKAGGTGLNLTGADTVVFYDHDWNPANDLQAQDRAYRIGQTKPVTVYKLVSKGTIETKMLQRQKMKKAVADEIIENDADCVADLTKEELLDLFQLDDEA